MLPLKIQSPMKKTELLFFVCEQGAIIFLYSDLFVFFLGMSFWISHVPGAPLAKHNPWVYTVQCPCHRTRDPETGLWNMFLSSQTIIFFYEATLDSNTVPLRMYTKYLCAFICTLYCIKTAYTNLKSVLPQKNVWRPKLETSCFGL